MIRFTHSGEERTDLRAFTAWPTSRPARPVRPFGVHPSMDLADVALSVEEIAKAAGEPFEATATRLVGMLFRRARFGSLKEQFDVRS